MDKQYSEKFFSSFINSIQKLCREFLEFDQAVEISGYLSVEIDNCKRERYVLSEMLHSKGNAISESYCTKAFKSHSSCCANRHALQEQPSNVPDFGDSRTHVYNSQSNTQWSSQEMIQSRSSVLTEHGRTGVVSTDVISSLSPVNRNVDCSGVIYSDVYSVQNSAPLSASVHKTLTISSAGDGGSKEMRGTKRYVSLLDSRPSKREKVHVDERPVSIVMSDNLATRFSEASYKNIPCDNSNRDMTGSVYTQSCLSSEDSIHLPLDVFVKEEQEDATDVLAGSSGDDSNPLDASDPSHSNQHIANIDNLPTLRVRVTSADMQSVSPGDKSKIERRKAPARKKYRTYSQTALTKAFTAVKNGQSVRGASKQYAVPQQTLRDRVSGKIDLECVKTGKPPLFSMDDEAKITDHLKAVTQYGYDYTRTEVTMLATDYGKQLGKITKPLTKNWTYCFLNRWPGLKIYRPGSLELARAKSALQPIVSKYFKELADIMTIYDLHDKPHLIFNVDEVEVTSDHTPPTVIGGKGKPKSVRTEKSQTTTLIGCGNAAGFAMPPFFVFAGKRWSDDLLLGGTPGASGTLSENGWSNPDIFRRYLENHFLQFAPEHSTNPLLLLMDGHITHVSLGLVEWAKSKNIILCIIPAYTSHILQPLDISCYGPFQRMYKDRCKKRMRTTSGKITQYNICEIACNVYVKALSPENLISGYRKTGIVPNDQTVIDATLLISEEIFTVEINNASEPESETQKSDVE